MEVYDEYILIMPPLILHTGDIFLMFEYASIHNTCKLHNMLDSESKVIKIQFSLDSVYTCHMMLYTCHRLVYPVIHQLHVQFFFIPLGKFQMLESAWMHIPYTKHDILE
jgi:hypothetical protein